MPIISAASSGSMRPLGFTYGAKPEWTDNTLSDFRYLDSYSDAVQASGTAPIRYSIVSGALPTGLSLNATTGAITGSTTATGTYNFTLQARNHLGTVTQSFTKDVPQAPVPPTYVSNGSNLTTTQNLSISMGTRQAGDIAILTFSCWQIGQVANAENTKPTNWTNFHSSYFSASVFDNQQLNFQNQYGKAESYYRVMTNTSADNFTYTLPNSMTVVWQWLIVRPAAGMTFSTSAGESGGQTGGPPAFGDLYIPPSNSYKNLHTFSANSYPKTVVSTNHSLGMTINSGPNYYVGVGSGTQTGSYFTSISNPTSMTRVLNNSYYTSAYITGFTDSAANKVFVGTFSYAGEPNYWTFNSTAVLIWSRA
jgi:hypothetical protein